MTEKQLAEFFVEQRVLQTSQAEDVLSEVELNGKTVEQAMLDGGFIDEPGFFQTIANGLGTDFVELRERTMRIALSDQFDLHTAEDLHFALGKDNQVMV